MTQADPRVEPSPGGLVLFYQDKALYHPDNPRERPERLARDRVLPGKCLVLVPSPLLGYGLEELLAGLPEDSRILCVEADEKLMALSSKHIAGGILQNPQISFVRSGSAESIMRHIENRFGFGLFRRCTTVALNRGYTLNAGFYRLLEKAVWESIQTFWRNRMTTLHMGRLWMANIFLNMALLPGSRPLTDLRLEKAAVVVGAGESLENHLPFLADYRSRLAIVCVDTALPALLAAGIRPDLITAAEAQFANIYDFLGLSDWSIPVAADLASYPGILRRFTGERYIFLSRFEPLSWFEREDVEPSLPPLIPPLGSVGVMAVYIACRAVPVGFPVFLAGMDFRYTPGKPHARGAPSHALHLINQERFSSPRQLSAWYERPKETAPLAEGGAAAVDSVLASYRAVLAEIVGNCGNVYSLAGPGLYLGAPVLGHREAGTLAADAGRLSRIGVGRVAAASSPWTESSIRSFYDNLLRGLGSMSEESLRDFDFLALDLPGTTAQGPEDDGFIRRCRERAVWYSERIRRGRENLSNLPRS